MSLHPIWITEDAPPTAFPDVDFALSQPNGLLAVGGDLSPERLLCAYRRGIFPWYSDGQPILWWSPDPRAVIRPEAVRVSRSLAKSIRNRGYDVRLDTAFAQVLRRCQAPRAADRDTWITEEMFHAYCELHRHGAAHSFECWRGDELVGGLYGVSVGRVFFGESMYSAAQDASKVALVHLCRTAGYALVDCQLPSDHLARLGAILMPRRQFVAALERWCAQPLATPGEGHP